MLETLINNIIPHNDTERLAALRQFEILYTPAEAVFDNITEMMAQVFNTPMAFISLVDQDKVFYKSQVGHFGRSYVKRENSLCSLAILGSEPLIIEDASGESCFNDNPYVKAKGGIRFYAGAPLITKEGYHIGAACVVDVQPRSFSKENKELLVRFASMVMHEIETRYAAFKQIEVQNRLAKAEAQLRAALDVGKITPWHWDVRTNKVYGDEALAQMFNVDVAAAREGLSIEPFIDSIHPDDQEYVRSRISSALEMQKEYEAEYRVYNSKQELRWVIGRGRARFDEEGPISLTGSLIDITDRKQVEATLAASEVRFRTLANSINQLAWMAEPEGWIYWYNDRWYEYTGTTLEEMQGWGWGKVHHADHKEKVISFVKEAWKKEEPWELTFPLRSHKGEYHWFLTRAYPVRNSEGKVVQWIGTNTNIDEHKKAEALLEQKVKERTWELEMRNKELEQFTYISHHDLQEPLRKIAIFADMVRSDSYHQLSEASQKRFDKITDAASRMSKALRDVLNYASLNKEEQLLEIGLDDILSDVQGDLEMVIAEQGAKICSESLPIIKAVPHQMHQLFYNLINNSLKFAKPDVPPVILIKCRQLDSTAIKEHTELDPNKQYYEIIFQDNGIGFNPEAAEKIFRMFQRLHSKQEYAGTGIGLALCKKVVGNHQGKIWAEGKEREGAAFKVLLPID